MNDKNKITKEQYLSLLDGNITKADYDTIISKIDARFHDILKEICTKFEWFDYDNGHEEKNGYFNPKKYSVFDLIYFDGVYSMSMPYREDGIPIRWLWEDFLTEFQLEVTKYKIKMDKKFQDQQQQRIELKAKKIKMKKIIQSKLTQEELRFIRFL